MADTILFYFFGGLAVLSAILVVTRRNAVHSAVFLVTALLATAGLFLQLRAEFLFIVQVILYVGGIMVLFIFVIMLVNLDVAMRQAQFNRAWYVWGLLAVAMGAQVYVVFHYARMQTSASFFNQAVAPVEQLEPNTQLVGQALFSTYMLPFEIASILLLVAMIGAVVMAKKRV
ncbi:MAG TPA: NADH-quinone oxidoreductase subunit J [Candidatus Acidoferrales bacterium]|nr:NADH-quinone oxidoreductase subunit J [Candidatus Acidoferrales bacterium]